VDVFFRDNRLDWGNTEQPSNTLFESNRGFIPHWESVDIKVDSPPFQPVPTDSQEFEAFTDEDPQASQTNRIYVRIRNRGPNSANEVTVKLHWAFAGTALPSLPSDFWSMFPTDSTDTSTWHPIEEQVITNLEYCGASVADTTDDKAQIVTFEFAAPALNPRQPAYQHYCLFCVLDSPQDSISASSIASFVPDNVTPRDNNVTQRNVILQPAVDERSSVVGFFARNPTKQRLKTKFRVTAPVGWKARLRDVDLGKPLELKPLEERALVLEITLPDPQAAGDVIVTQQNLSDREPFVQGGLTIRFRDCANRSKQ
jgi:hypothetical protein